MRRTTRSASVKSDTGRTPTPTVTKSNTTQSRKKGQISIPDPVEYNAPLSPQGSQPPATATQPPKKRGRKPKAATGTSDADKLEEPLPKKAKSSTVKAPPQNRDALPSTRRTSKQVAADHEAARKAAQEEVERGKAAVRLLAEMQVDEEMFDEDMEIDNPHHLDVVGMRSRVESEDNEGESFESISSGPDSDSDEDELKLSNSC